MPAPPVSRLILLLSGSGLSLRVLGQLPYPVSLGAYTGDVIQLVSLHTNHQPSVSCQFLCNACAPPLHRLLYYVLHVLSRYFIPIIRIIL